jgi:hypothetical protein
LTEDRTADDMVLVTVIDDTGGTDKVMGAEGPNPAGCKP